MPVVAVDIPDPKEGTRLPPSISLTTPPPSRANAPHRSPLRLPALLLSRSNHGPTGSLARSTPDNSTPPLHTPPPPLPVSALPAPQITPVRTYRGDTPASSHSTPLRSGGGDFYSGDSGFRASYFDSSTMLSIRQR